MIYASQEIEHEQAVAIAQKMCVAARTAPKARGLDYLKTAVLTSTDKEVLAEKMEALAPSPDSFLVRDAGCVRKSEAVVLIGTTYQTRGLNELCQLCRHDNCADCAAGNGVCVYDPMDLGIAIGSAVSIAADNRVDTRVMFSAGVAAKALSLLGDDVVSVIAIPVAVSGKSPFFDR